MASTKSLFFLGFALSAAVLAVSSSPVVESRRSEENFAKEFIFGKRQPGDYSPKSMTISETHTVGQLLEFYEFVTVTRRQVITCITVADRSGGNDTEVLLAFGGPGYNGAVLHFIGANGVVDIQAKIYVKNDY